MIGSMERAREQDAATQPLTDDEELLNRLQTVQRDLAVLESELGRRLGAPTGATRGETD